MNFWKKTQVNSDEYEKLSKKIIDLSSDVQELTAKIRTITSDVSNLRGLFNRKLIGLKKEEVGEVEEQQEQKGINNQVILPYDGTIFKHNK